MAEGIQVFSDADFDEQVVNASQPTLVDFTAEWCAPCKALAPVIKEVAEAYDGRIRVGTVDVDANIETAAKYAVRTLPTLLLFKDGQVVGQLVGLVKKAKLDDMIDKNIG